MKENNPVQPLGENSILSSEALMSLLREQYAKLIVVLWERWQDEQHYEDINDYLAEIQKHLPTAYAIKGRPFCIKFKTLDDDLKVVVKSQGDQIKLTITTL